MRAHLALAAVLALIAAFGAGSVQGHRAERKSWELITARAARDAALMQAKAEAAARAHEQDLAVLKDQIEKEHLDAQAQIAAALAGNARRLAAAGGLRDRAGTCRADNVPPASAAPAGPVDPAAGCRLSEGTSGALLDLAARADRTAAYAAACHAWVTGLR